MCFKFKFSFSCSCVTLTVKLYAAFALLLLQSALLLPETKVDKLSLAFVSSYIYSPPGKISSHETHCKNVKDEVSLLICTLISKNQGLEKSRSASNVRKISGPAKLNFFIEKKARFIP